MILGISVDGLHARGALADATGAVVARGASRQPEKGDAIVEVTHGALQDRDGTWTSKLGQLALIRHRTPAALNGPTYGQPVAVYARRSARSGDVVRRRPRRA